MKKYDRIRQNRIMADENATTDSTELSELTDEALVALAKAQNGAASDELYYRYKNLVRGRARPYFLMGADREDLIQEGMIGFFKAVRDYDIEKNNSFRPFAEMCITRQIFTAIRNATRDKHIPLNQYESLYKPAFDEDSDKQLIDILSAGAALDPEELYIRQELSLSVERALNERLTDFERSVLDRYLMGMSYSEIAKELCRGTKAVDNALQRIRKKLEAPLAEFK